MSTNAPGEQPAPDANPFSIDLERLTTPEIVLLSEVFSDRGVLGDRKSYPNINAWGHIDDRTHELAERDPARGRAIYEAYSQSERDDDRSWFLDTLLRRYVALDPEAGAFDLWGRLVTDPADHVRRKARQELVDAFSDDEGVTTDRLAEVGLTLHDAGRLLITIVQHEEQLRQEQDQA
jgi:hypothetical protein